MVSTLGFKTIRLKWEELYSEAALYRAALDITSKSLFCPRKAIQSSYDDTNLYDYLTHHRSKLRNLHKDLIAQRFEFQPVQYRYTKFFNKGRDLYIEPWHDKIVDLMLYKALNALFRSQQSSSTYAYRPDGFCLDSCQHKIRKFIKGNKGLYIIKRDISSYFQNIDHNILIEQLSQLFDDQYLLRLLVQRIKAECIADSNFILNQGILFGTPLACFFANIHLHSMDLELDGISNVFYARYADDILLMSSSYSKISHARTVLTNNITTRNLCFKNKGTIDNELENINKFKFLGLMFDKSGAVRIGREKTRKIQNFFKRAFRRCSKLRRISDVYARAQLLIDVARKIIESGGVTQIAIIDYYLKHCSDEQQIKLIDRWLAEEILSRVTGKGHRKKNFKVVSYKELRKMGLPSLLHRKRLINHGHIQSSFFAHRNKRLAAKANK